MSTFTEFLEMICGHFNNEEQVTRYQEAGNHEYPFAEHINTICNDKVINLPNDFDGIFLLEESYYTLNGKTNAMPHLFLITMTPVGIQLSSYEIPKQYDKDTFTYENVDTIDFSTLQQVKKFNPLIYKEENHTFHGKSESMFTPVLKFTIDETFSDEMLLVSEIFEVNGKRTFGFDNPIEYKRIK